MEPGEYAVRGGILDLYPPGRSSPVRLDFFGDTLEHIKAFDPETQRTGKIVQRLTLMPMSEVAFGPAAEKLLPPRLCGDCSAPRPRRIALYEAVSAGQRYPGVEHWLPLFHDRLETLFDYAPDAPVSFDHLAEEAVGERLALIEDHYEARVEGLEALKFGAPPVQAGAAAAAVLHAAGVGRGLGRAPGAPACRRSKRPSGRAPASCARWRGARGATLPPSARPRASTCSPLRRATCAPCRRRANA